MCNLYSETKGQEAIRKLSRAMRDVTPAFPGNFPDYLAPILLNAPDGVRELTTARWGMLSSQPALFEVAKKRAQKLEAKGQQVDFNRMVLARPSRRGSRRLLA